MKNLGLFILIFIPLISYSQSRNGSFNGTNYIHYQIPSTSDLSFLKNDNESVEVFVFPLGGDRNKEVSEQLKDIQSIVMNRLMESGVKLEKGNVFKGNSVKNEVQIGLNILKTGKKYSYIARILVRSGAYIDYEEKFSYKSGLILWEKIHFGIANQGNYSKIRKDILSSIDSLIKAIGD